MSQRTRALLLVALGLGLAGYGWFDVRRRARVDRAPRFHRTDFTVYQFAARALKADKDAYEARNPRGYRYVYPPFFATLLVPIAGWDPANAALLFFALSMVLLLYALVTLRDLPDARGDPLGWKAVAIATFLCVGFLHQSFQRGQVTVLLLALHVFAMHAIAHQRWFVGALLLSLAGAVRLTPFFAVAAFGVALLVWGARHGWKRFLHFAGGALAGIVLAFVVVPWLFLGPSQAQAATERWWASTKYLYGSGADDSDLLREYKINEYRFKNQAPRRVFSTYAGWASGVPFEKERPLLTEADRELAHDAAWILALTVLMLGVFIALRALDKPHPVHWAVALAVLGFLPVLVTRYTWPTHFTGALPLLAYVAASNHRRHRAALWVFLGGTALFYAAHAKPLQVVGAAGPLLIATLTVLVLLRVHKVVDHNWTS